MQAVFVAYAQRQMNERQKVWRTLGLSLVKEAGNE